MKFLIKGARVIDPSTGLDAVMDVLFGDRIIKIEKNIDKAEGKVIDASGLVLSPGFVDLHTHTRDPGFTYKEDLETVSLAAAAGGFTTITAMPNTDPPMDCPAVVRYVKEKSERIGIVEVLPVGAITKGRKGKELAEIGLMVSEGAVAISDDGNWVSDSRLMRLALMYAKMFNIPVISHPEDTTLTKAGLMNEGIYSALLGVPGMPPEAEQIAVFRDVILARSTGAHLHLTHLSTGVSLEIVRWAKNMGVTVTCDVTPHHLSLSERYLIGLDPFFKVNPPLRSVEDVVAVREAIHSGVVDAVATDHAPHGYHEKEVEFLQAPFGFPGLETALPVLLTYVYHTGVLPLVETIALITYKPATILRIKRGTLEPGAPANLVLFDPDKEITVDPSRLKSKAKYSPFAGFKLKGQVVKTFYKGKEVFSS